MTLYEAGSKLNAGVVRYILQIMLVTLITACGDSSDNSLSDQNSTGATTTSKNNNAIPTASAGNDRTANEGFLITLTGLGQDTDGNITKYAWTQLNGPSVILNDANRASATFTAPSVNVQTTVSFRLTVTDNDGATGRDEVTITINAINNAPIASNDNYGVGKNQMLNITGMGVLNNDADPENDVLIASLVSTTSNGTLSLGSDGGFTYTPDTDFVGIDSFSYAANDGELSSTNATVSITVTDNVNSQMAPIISSIPDDSILQGNTYSLTPILQQGGNVRWTKAYGQDDMTVDAVSGKVTWVIPPTLPGESFHLGVKATNAQGSHLETWVLTVGTGNVIYVGASETYTTLKAGMAAMNSGDTLIMRDGVYLNSDANRDNSIAGSSFKGQQPPSGTATSFTTVMAENPGQVILDGQGDASSLISMLGTYDPPEHSYDSKATVPREYIAIKGVVVKNSITVGIRLAYTRYIKLIDIGVVDSAAAAAQEASNATNVYINRSDAILVEGLYSWGHSRYKMQFKDTTRGVVRRSIIRLDGYRGDQPVGGFQSYCSRNIVYQNNIAVDGDQSDFWTNFSNHQGLYGVPATGCSSYPEGNVFERNIGLNSHTGLMQTDAGDNPNPTIWRDMVGWDLKMDRYEAGTGGHVSIMRGTGASLSDQITMGRVTADPGYEPFSGGGRGFFYSRSDDSFVNNSIIYQFGWNGGTVVDQGPLMWAGSHRFDFDYNNIYDFAGTQIGGSVGTITNSITTDPLSNGLIYLPRIERGSTLETAGEGGKRVGANVLTFVGKSGTFYGEPGYDQETNLSMWPFPHEDLFKEKFQNYSFTDVTRSSPTVPLTLSGNRGFASSTAKQLNGVDDVTLTSYVWEYLGKPMPDEIYRTPWSLAHYTPQGAAFTVPEIGTNLSGITYNWDSGTYFTVKNNSKYVYEYSADFQTHLRTIFINTGNSSDNEGITYLGNDEFAVANESNYLMIFSIANASTTGVAVQRFTLPSASVSNKGLEGVCYDRNGNGTLYAIQEKSPMRIFKFDRPNHTNDLTHVDNSLVYTEPFQAETVFNGIATDIAGCMFNPMTGRLLILSQESRKVMDVDLNGDIVAELPLPIVSNGGAPQYEGVAIGKNGELVFASEKNWVHTYQ